jgi:hypothetical protein
MKVDTGPGTMTSMSVGNHYLPIIVVELVEGVTARKDTLKAPVGDFRIRDGMKVLIWTMMLYHEHSVAICPIPQGLLPLLNVLLAPQAFCDVCR